MSQYGPPQGFPGGVPPQAKKFSPLPWILGIVLALALLGAGLYVLLKPAGGIGRDEYTAGVTKVLTPVFAKDLTDEQITEIASCITDKTYDEVSEETRKMVAEGQDIMPGNPDHQTIFDASSACSVKVSMEAEQAESNPEPSSQEAQDPEGATTSSEATAAPDASPSASEGTGEVPQGSPTPPSSPGLAERAAYDEGIMDLAKDNLSSMLSGDQIEELAECLAESTYDDASQALRNDVIARAELTPENPEHAPIFAMIPVCAERTGVMAGGPGK